MNLRSMPKESYPVLEGDIKIQDLQGNVFLEVEGDCWYASVTLSQEAVTGLQEWLSLYRQAAGF